MEWHDRAREHERRAAVLAVTIVVALVMLTGWLCSAALGQAPSRARMVVEAAAECGCDPYTVTAWLDMERLAGVPERLRGLLAATACSESHCTADALGDWREVRGERIAKAVGWFQLWPWAVRAGADRRDAMSAAGVYLGQISNALRTTRRACGKRVDLWVVAWMRVNRGPRWRTVEQRGNQRCDGALPGGLRELRRWGKAARVKWPTAPLLGRRARPGAAQSVTPHPPVKFKRGAGLLCLPFNRRTFGPGGRVWVAPS